MAASISGQRLKTHQISSANLSVSMKQTHRKRQLGLQSMPPQRLKPLMQAALRTPPTRVANTQPHGALSAITPHELQSARARLKPVTDVHAGADTHHIRVQRGSPEIEKTSPESHQGYLGPVGANPGGWMSSHEFVDFYTDVRRTMSQLRAPVINPFTGMAHQSEGDQLVRSVDSYAQQRETSNFLRIHMGQAPLPSLDVGIAYGPNASSNYHDPVAARNGLGSGSTVLFDPRSPVNPGWDVPGVGRGEGRVPNSILLGHELIHSRGAQQGRTDPNYNREEFLTVGLTRADALQKTAYARNAGIINASPILD